MNPFLVRQNRSCELVFRSFYILFNGYFNMKSILLIHQSPTNHKKIIIVVVVFDTIRNFVPNR